MNKINFVFQAVWQAVYLFLWKTKLLKLVSANGDKTEHNESIKNQGPPDLDEVFAQWKKKIEDFLGENKNTSRGHNSGNGSNYKGGGRIFKIRNFSHRIIWFVVIVVILGWLSTGIYTVDSNERGVVMQFGRFTHVTEPGLHWRFPHPFQSHVIVVYSTVRTFEIGRAAKRGSTSQGAQMLTGDENVLLANYTLQYDVQDAPNYVYSDVNPDTTTRLAAETAMREVVGNSTLDKVLYEDREEVARQAKEIMQSILDHYAVGIRVLRVNLQSVRPPAEVQAAFDDAIKASQDKQRQINEGEAYAQKVVPRARGRASRILEQAAGYKEAVIAQAKGEASRYSQFYDEYAKAKEVTRERLYLDTMSEVFSRSRKVLIDPQARSFINLDKKMPDFSSAIINENLEDDSSTTNQNNTQNKSQQSDQFSGFREKLNQRLRNSLN